MDDVFIHPPTATAIAYAAVLLSMLRNRIVQEVHR